MTHVFKEDLENTTGLFVDETGDTLDTTTTGKTTNSLKNRLMHVNNVLVIAS